MKINLDGDWTLTFTSPLHSSEGQTIPARVPGNVELDMERESILPELFRGDNILELRHYEACEWLYETEFTTPPGRAERPVRLVFHGVDCLATYWLNGKCIGESENAFIEHSFEVGPHLSESGENKLAVRIRSAVVEAGNREYEPMMEALQTNWAQLWIRKPAHCYGWDIMPRAVSAGIWRSVDLEIVEEHEILELYFYTTECGRRQGDGSYVPARMELFYQLSSTAASLWDAEIRVRGRCGDSAFEITKRAFFTAGKIAFEVPSPLLWWPLGYGDANLYEVTVELVLGDRVLAQRTELVGIRTIELVRTEVTSSLETGQFLFKVNGEPIFCKGSNWVPADAFHSRDAERYEDLLELFRDLGCNMLRCWGGNVYEDHKFFDICDRLGIMVWQDFAMACAIYPQEESFIEQVRREAVSVIRKLRNHASLVVWCGDNECDNQWKEPSKNRLTREMLPEAVMCYDGQRPYIPSSPYWAPEAKNAADFDMLPERHLWGPRDYYKSRDYTEHKAHFVGEIGYHGCPNLSSMRRFLDPDHLWPWQENSQWLTHCSDPVGHDGAWAYRIKLMADQITEMFGETPSELEDFILASQVSQAEAKKFFIEMTRLSKWRRTGILWWNVADGWPQFSDAVVDYYLGKKLAYNYIRRVQAPVCIMIDEPSDWHVEVLIGNDSLKEETGSFRVWDADNSETLLQGRYVAPANSTTNLGRIPVTHSDKKMLLIQWDYRKEQSANHYLLGFPPFDLDRYRSWLVAVSELPGGFDASAVGK